MKTPQEREAYREKLWSFIIKKEIPKMAKQFSMARHTAIINCKKVCVYIHVCMCVSVRVRMVQ